MSKNEIHFYLESGLFSFNFAKSFSILYLCTDKYTEKNT